MTDNPPEGNEPPSEPEVDPEEVGSDLFRRLDQLDDRLQRSQEQMLSLLDRKLNDLQGPDSQAGIRPAPASPYSRWTLPSGIPSETSSGPLAHSVADQKSMDAWFSGASGAPTASPSTSSQTQSGTAPGPADQASELPTAVSPIPEGLHPAWQSNALTVLITGLVVVVGLFLVGLL